MQHIIDSLKAATGPDRFCDALIYEAIELPRCEEPDCLPDVMARNIARMKAGGGDDCECPAYTASIDAAVALIPDGMFWIAGHGRTRPDEPLAGASVVTPEDQINPVGEAEGDHVAICICIAALEARLSLQPPT